MRWTFIAIFRSITVSNGAQIYDHTYVAISKAICTLQGGESHFKHWTMFYGNANGENRINTDWCDMGMLMERIAFKHSLMW